MLIALLLQTAAINIICEYVSTTQCSTNNLKVQFSNETVTSISGNRPNTIHENIETLVISKSPFLLYFPSGVENFFPNLSTIAIASTGIKSLKNRDLEKFPKLKILNLKGNQIEELNSNVFELNKNIEKVDLSDNKLKYIGSDIAKNLKVIDLSNNICINATAKNTLELEELKLKLLASCDKNNEKLHDAPVGEVATVSLILWCIFGILFAILMTFCVKLMMNYEKEVQQ